MSILRDVVSDLVAHVFDLAVKKARAKFPSAERLLVTREDLLAAVLELRYEHLVLVCSQLDVLREQGKRDAEAAAARGAENAEYVETTIVEPTGDEPTTQPFKK